MKRRIHHLKHRRSLNKRSYLFAAVFGFLGITFLSLSLAATPTIQFYLNPSTQTVKAGDGFKVQIRLSDSNAAYIGYAKAVLTFPANNLAVSSISIAGSDFPTGDTLTYDNTAGSIHITREGKQYDYQAKDFLLATVTFVAKNAGDANVTFTSTSSAKATQQSGNLLTGTVAGNYSISGSTPAPSPSPTPDPTPTPDPGTCDVDCSGDCGNACTDPTPPDPTIDYTNPSDNYSDYFNETQSIDTSTAGDTPGSNTTPASSDSFAIKNIIVNNITDHDAKLSWELTSPSSSTVIYGFTSTALNRAVIVPKSKTSQSVVLHNLLSGKKVYYQLSSKGVQKNGSFTTKRSTSLRLVAVGGGSLSLVVVAVIVFLLFKKQALGAGSHKKELHSTPPSVPHSDRLLPGTINVLPTETIAPGAAQAIPSSSPKAPQSPSSIQPPSQAAIPSTPQPVVSSSLHAATLHVPQQSAPQRLATVNTGKSLPAASMPQAISTPDMFEIGQARLQQEGIAQQPPQNPPKS